ncbi:hypothetical protein GDO78_012182 [Eleutherodactylus coqui]|uniref:Uncharacterized protein n=1 Tax=Eleutherodactylus coqui TaxID=57060 RepID=A0A8J6F4V5_ELECQ|nr:hypothetical protein GDO78_012182 [Eleutherodactylus coqui]
MLSSGWIGSTFGSISRRCWGVCGKCLSTPTLLDTMPGLCCSAESWPRISCSARGYMSGIIGVLSGSPCGEAAQRCLLAERG